MCDLCLYSDSARIAVYRSQALSDGASRFPLNASGVLQPPGTGPSAQAVPNAHAGHSAAPAPHFGNTGHAPAPAPAEDREVAAEAADPPADGDVTLTNFPACLSGNWTVGNPLRVPTYQKSSTLEGWVEQLVPRLNPGNDGCLRYDKFFLSPVGGRYRSLKAAQNSISAAQNLNIIPSSAPSSAATGANDVQVDTQTSAAAHPGGSVVDPFASLLLDEIGEIGEIGDLYSVGDDEFMNRKRPPSASAQGQPTRRQSQYGSTFAGSHPYVDSGNTGVGQHAGGFAHAGGHGISDSDLRVSDLSVRENHVAQRARVLDERARDFANFKTDLDVRASELALREKDLDLRIQDAKAFEDEINSRVREVTDVQDELERRERELTDFQDVLERRARELANQQDELARRARTGTGQSRMGNMLGGRASRAGLMSRLSQSSSRLSRQDSFIDRLDDDDGVRRQSVFSSFRRG